MHRVGLAVAAAVDAARLPTDGAGSVGLKWPNDVLLDGRKLAGVLAQRSTQAPGVVVGFGVNVHWAPPGAASLGGADGVSPAGLLADVLVAFDALPADITDLYRQRLVTLGQRVRVELSGRSATSGTAVDLDEAGRLIVIDDAGERHRFDVGDVVHLRPGD
jgi:BirA family biotin operon repressor/biotin-[acetyl-CoA-carboxylase] ligase